MVSCPKRIKSLWLGLPGLRQRFHMTHLRDCFLGNGLQLCPEGWLFYFFKSIFGCIGSWLLCRASSSCGKWGLVFLTVPGLSGFSCCRAQAPGTQASVVVAHSLRSCGPWAQLLLGMWDLPGPGMEPVSPALAGRVPSLCHQGNPERWCLTSLFHFPFCLSKYYHLSWVCWWLWIMGWAILFQNPTQASYPLNNKLHFRGLWRK